MSDVPVLQVNGLVKHFAVSRGLIRQLEERLAEWLPEVLGP